MTFAVDWALNNNDLTCGVVPQVHHLFSTIPHYHLEEATQAFRRHFPQLVCKRDERIFVAFMRMFSKWAQQHVVGDSALVHVYT